MLIGVFRTEYVFSSTKAVFSFKKFSTKNVTLNLAILVWSIKCRRKKLIAQFGWKLRDERFEHN